MNNDLLINSMRALQQNWGLTLALLAVISWGALLVFAALKKITDGGFDNAEILALALGGWPLPVLLLSLTVIFLLPFSQSGFIFTPVSIFIILSAVFATYIARKDFKPELILPVFIFLLLFFLRLGFIDGISLPPYFDSAEHYRIIQNLLNLQGRREFTWPAPAYYHIGYHITIAALAFFTDSSPAAVMLVFGQAALASIPFPVYFFTRRATGSNTAALFGLTLAAFGWYMPAHAVNWGKYPALLSLLLIQFTLGAMMLKNRSLIALASIASVLIHTRSVIVFCITGFAWALSNRIHYKQSLFPALAASMLGMAMLLGDWNQTIGPTFDPYRIPVTLLAGLLSVSAARSFPRLVVFSNLALLGIFAASLIPVSASYTLLDRPLVEMILFLPLAFLGGLGAAHLPKFAAALLAVAIVFYALTNHRFTPSECCQLAGRNDLAALGWMKNKLPDNARIAIAVADLNVDSFSAPMPGTGTDAGIWVALLTGRDSIPLPYFTDFLLPGTHEALCSRQVTHIYIGSRPQSFRVDLGLSEAWYEVIMEFPGAQVVEVKGCK